MSQSDEFEEIRLIADAVCDGDVTPEQMQNLEGLLAVSEEAKSFYLEYVGMHAHLKAAADPKIELVMRRSQIDELIVRPTGSNSSLATSPNLSEVTTPLLAGPQPKLKNSIILFLAVVCAILLTYILMQDSKDYLGEVRQGKIKDLERLTYPEKFMRGEFIAETDSLLKLKNASSIKFTAGSHFNLTDPNKIFLEKGRLNFNQESDQSLKLSTTNFKIVSASKSIYLNHSHDSSTIKINSENKFLPARWRPKHYWSFDRATDRAIDSAGDAHGVVSTPVKAVEGLLGKGAFHFDGTDQSVIKLGSGGGTALATGSFAVSDGLTIEALVKTEWSGAYMNSDEIFRKDFGEGNKGDGNMRMLFCFQNDFNKIHVFPTDYHGPTLSFGLYLVGQGYHELKLPLDGQEGRPTLEDLKDGEAHHVTATYDVRSGLKGIYIDGILLISHQYDPGTKMLTGGPGSAVIGNTSGTKKEAFTGIIDEVAFYDFALPPFMVQHHYNNIQNDLNYYGLKPNGDSLPEKLSLELPANENILIDSLTGLPSKIEASQKIK